MPRAPYPYEDRQWPVGRSRMAFGEWQISEGWKSRDSKFHNRIALVEVWEWEGPKPGGVTGMRFQIGGTEYIRHFRRFFGPKMLARLAREFVEEKTGEKVNA